MSASGVSSSSASPDDDGSGANILLSTSNVDMNKENDSSNKQSPRNNNLAKSDNTFNLLEAVQNRNISGVQDFLAKLLISACEEGNDKTVKLLLEAGADPNARQESNGRAALHVACFHNSSKVVPLLVEHGADVNLLDKDGQNPLFYALEPWQPPRRASNCYLEPPGPENDTVRFLLEQNTNASCVNKEGKSLLLLAVTSELDDDIISLLLQHGADTSAIYPFNRTILHILAETGGMNQSTVQDMIEHGVPLDVQDDNGDTALHLTRKAGGSFDGGMGAALKLIDAGANVSIPNGKGETPLHLFVNVSRAGFQTTRLQVVESLLEHGADVNATDHKGNTPMHAFADSERQGDFVELFDRLIDAGSNVNATNKKGSTPLHAVCGGRWLLTPYETVELLIQEGALVNAKNNDMYTPLMLCCKKWFNEGDKVAILDLLIESGANVNEMVGGFSPLSRICYMGQRDSPQTTKDCIDLLMNAGAVLDSGPGSIFPLHAACFTLNLAAATTLLDDYGANVRDVILGGKLGNQTPLHCVFAATGERNDEHNTLMQKLVTLLLKHRADPNAKNTEGQTPLGIAWLQNCELTVIYEMMKTSPIPSLQGLSQYVDLVFSFERDLDSD